MRRAGRRLALVALVSLALGVALGATLTSSYVVRRVGGDFAGPPREAVRHLSPRARRLVREGLAGLGEGPVIDRHVHVLAMGTDVEGAYVSERMTTWMSPVRYFKYLVYRSAAGIEDTEHADAQFRDRLIELARGLPIPARLHLLAFDQRYRPDGSVDRERTEFHVPNAYVFALAGEHPDLFVPVMSVHPYRPDALQALERWAREGGRTVKWLPNAMGIDPADPRLDPYYEKMRALGLTLLTHAGEEQAVESSEDQALGNPLRLRRALDHGVRVIVAHCASLGTGVDLDDPERREVPAFDLFLRLMGEPRYRGLLFGDISGLTLFNRDPRILRVLLERRDLQERLVYGSDYPVPAINALVHIDGLVDAGLLDPRDADPLREIYAYQPLLFDLVLKRRLRHPESGARLADEVFLPRDDLP